MIVHTGALAWVASTSDDDDEEVPALVMFAQPRADEQQPQATPDDAPIEVTFFEYRDNRVVDPAVAETSSSSGDAAPGKRGTGRFSTGATGTNATRGTTGGTDGVENKVGEPVGRSPLMTIRKPGSERLKGPSGGFLDKFLENSKPLPPPPDIPGERVGEQIADLRAQLKRAGRYSPEELAAKRAELVALNAKREAEELKPAGGGTYKTEKETFRAKVNADGSLKLEDKPENMDSQDKLMLRHGIDPYAKVKLDYMDRTREQRVAIGKRHREQELKKSVVYMRQHIAKLYATTSDVAKIKESLFELWDECSENGTPEEIAGGEAARAFVMAVIRTKVKYTAEELRALNAKRHSKQAFEP